MGAYGHNMGRISETRFPTGLLTEPAHAIHLASLKQSNKMSRSPCSLPLFAMNSIVLLFWFLVLDE